MPAAFSDERIEVTCPACSAHYQVPARKRGKRSRCRRCQESFLILSDADVSRRAHADEHVQVACPFCSRRYTAKRRKLGKSMNCRSCAKLFRLLPVGARGLDDQQHPDLQVDREIKQLNGHTRSSDSEVANLHAALDQPSEGRPIHGLSMPTDAEIAAEWSIEDQRGDPTDKREDVPSIGAAAPAATSSDEPGAKRDTEDADQGPQAVTSSAAPTHELDDPPADLEAMASAGADPSPDAASADSDEWSVDAANASDDARRMSCEATDDMNLAGNQSLQDDPCEAEDMEGFASPEEPPSPACPKIGDDIPFSVEHRALAETQENPKVLETLARYDKGDSNAGEKTTPEIPRSENVTGQAESGAAEPRSQDHYSTAASQSQQMKSHDIRILARMSGHACPVTAIAISAAGSRLVSADAAGELRLWDLNTQSVIHVWQAWQGPIWDVAFAAQDQKICIAGGLGQLLCVDHDAPEDMGTQLQAQSSAITSIAPCERRGVPMLLTTSKEPVAALWNLRTAKTQKRLVGHRDRIAASAVSPDGQYAITASWDATARVWNLDRGEQIAILDGGEGRFLSLAADWSSRTAWVGSQDGTVYRWHWPAENTGIKQTRTDAGPVTCIYLDPGSTASHVYCFTGTKKIVALHRVGQIDAEPQCVGIGSVVTRCAGAPRQSIIYAAGYGNDVVGMECNMPTLT